MKRCLVTGAGGFIGSYVVRWLLKEGYQVRATDLPRANLEWAEKEGAEVMKADLLDRKQLPTLLKDVDWVFHVAGLFDFSLPYDVLFDANVVATRNVCEAALQAGVESFVHWSTVGVYGRTFYIPMDEAHPKNPTNNYEKTKWMGEQVAMSYAKRGLPVRAIRPTLVYGPGSKYGVALFLSTVVSGYWEYKKAPVRVIGDMLTHHVHADDVARAAIHLAKRPDTVGRAFNVADDRPVTMTEMFDAMADALGIEKGVPLPILKKFVKIAIAATSPLAPMLEKTIVSVFGLINKSAQKKWDAAVKKYNLKDVLRPRIDMDWLFSYGAVKLSTWKWIPAGDKWYDTSALKSTGFTCMWPDFREGLKKTVEWYQENGWLPKAS
jgi:nucleoside-diphosphate-sugar epimerase